MSNPDVTLVLLGEPCPHLGFEELEPSISPHTEKLLRRLAVTVVTQGDEQHEQLQEELASTGFDEAILSDTGGGKWKVARNNYSYRSSEKVSTYTHSIELEEREELVLEKVLFEGLTLVPERWQPIEMASGLYMMEILAQVDPETHKKLENVLQDRRFVGDREHRYFDVTLVGVKSAPAKMRFGRCLWEPGSEGVRHCLVFVPYEDDESNDQPAYEPAMTRLQEQSVIASIKLDTLITELQKAGVIGDAAVDRINNIPDPLPRREFERTRNIMEFFV
ncbi:hypothetical protein LWP59_27675 [Amycolatopsis acidiphila]|uniref:Uncharacterized protein n=1 Tax=Amycolatopsis acidiphila TaxID=715473 RepID=A0A558A135_9PSEU|nr:hypothetical protein [Amycolatopsis acidiphila]TVT17973.1 hypothetical protein FNH06_29570 [Amycolatopsis acidiphila]UIJ57874.1 hypothetical protein LWP59_27560 [Amycolatopsis acidiphila]UIJ57896.1 hypothetical protein LWP59_27675 [Amycolatopsis acidiphila]GHG71269.1 hypothetical protein GCM10017788_33070 [Amycolatopsis acidiphila]